MNIIKKYYLLLKYDNLISDEEVLKRMPSLPHKSDGTRLTRKEINKLFNIIKVSMIESKLKDI